MRVRITEYLEVDIDKEMWVCNRCDQEIFSARQSYKRGCKVQERDPRDVHQPFVDGPYSYAPDPYYCRILEFYCPGCGTMVENEYLPPGHPIIEDIILDMDKLKAKYTGVK